MSDAKELAEVVRSFWLKRNMPTKPKQALAELERRAEEADTLRAMPLRAEALLREKRAAEAERDKLAEENRYLREKWERLPEDIAAGVHALDAASGDTE